MRISIEDEAQHKMRTPTQYEARSPYFLSL
jgi:hypothetical protein